MGSIKKNVIKKSSFYDRKLPKIIVFGMSQNLYVKIKQINSSVYYFLYNNIIIMIQNGIIFTFHILILMLLFTILVLWNQT